MSIEELQALPINIDPEILGGTPVFKGTRVPVRTVFDYLADGGNMDEFLDDYPSVSRANAITVLEVGASCLLFKFTETLNPGSPRAS